MIHYHSVPKKPHNIIINDKNIIINNNIFSNIINDIELNKNVKFYIFNNNNTFEFIDLAEEIVNNNLKIISELSSNKKLNLIKNSSELNKNKLFNYYLEIDNSIFPQLSRWYYNNSRDKIIEYIEIIINEGLNFYTYYKKNFNYFKTIEIYNNLKNSLNGLDNLIITYKNDKKITDNINNLIKKINIYIIDEL